MNHSQLRAFHAVASEGSFTRAANRLRVSQPTLSGHVKSLEEGYDVRLFQRRSREVVLTDFGRALFEITQRYFASEIEAQRLLATAQGLVSGRLHVAADSPFAVVPLLARFSHRFPGVQIKVQFANSAQILRRILAGTSDIGILPQIDDNRHIHSLTYLQDILVVLVSRGHPWSQRRSVHLSEIADQTLISREPGSTTRAIFEAAMAARNVRPAHVLEMGSREAVREAVAAGLGIGVVSESEFGFDKRLHKLSVAGDRLKVVESVICRKDLLKDNAVAAFLELVRQMSGQGGRPALQ
ncbi:MAG TPA: LysR family transcriptional regulator [Rhizobiales bacterium]|nr:LysR family transcriptional regulator [Hyphomicrobiales bacterium]